MSLADAILRMSTGRYTVTRPGPVTWTAGAPVEAAGTEFEIDAAIVPASNKDLQRLPEGERSGDVVKILTATELRTAESSASRLSDRISYLGRTYEVEDVDVWPGFYDAIARRVGQ